MDEYKKHNDYSNAEEADFVEIDTKDNNFRVLRRSAKNKILFGVCGGLAEYYNIHPLLFRIIFVIAFFYSNTAIFLYGILAFLIKPPVTDEIRPYKLSAFIGYLILIYGAIFYIGNNSVIFHYIIGTINFPIYVSFLFAFLGLYILVEAEKFTNKTATFNRTKLYKVSKNKIIGGVCSGFSRYLQISLAAVRTVFVLVFILTVGLFLFIYLLLFWLLPNLGDYDA